jgi:phosphate/sulfate permease
MGSIVGIGVLERRQTNWRLVRQIVLAWMVTLPLGLACGFGFYSLLETFA